MIRWEEGVVLDIVEERDGLQLLSVAVDQGTERLQVKAILYTALFPPVRRGSLVRLNTTARHLRLGTGGYDFVCAPSPSDDPLGLGFNDRQHQVQGHMMKLRYTPLQMKVHAAEEPSSPHHELFNERNDIERVPVLIGALHSMLPSTAAWLYQTWQQEKRHHENSMPRIVYIMSDGGALPLSFSEHVSRLKRLGWIVGTVTYGHAFGGDLETMNKYSALLAARFIFQADMIIITMGPGIAGTGTKWGHTGLEMGEIIHAVAALNGTPIMIPRLSFAEDRSRHRGLSHHVVTILEQTIFCKTVLPLPTQLKAAHKRHLLDQTARQIKEKHDVRWVDEPQLASVKASHLLYGAPITTMGRTVNEDPEFFLGVAAAAQVALEQQKETLHF